jgi:hypothetical protein
LERQAKDVVLRIPNTVIDAAIEKEVTEAIVALLTRQKPSDAAATRVI